MLRSRSFHKSTPNLNLTSGPLSRASSSARPPNQQIIIGRDELEERYLNLRDQHYALRREATSAQEEVRQLHVKLSRLIDEKKRYFKHRRTDREVALEEQIYDLEQELGKTARQNERMRDRMQLMRVQGSVGQSQMITTTTTQKRISSAYGHIQSRTDSGLGPPPGTVFSFRPLSVSKSTLDLRPKSGILKHTQPDPTETTNGPQMSLTATMLMKEAKEEIMRLEEIVSEQQMMLDTLLGGSRDLEDDDEGSHHMQQQPPTTSHQISYQLTTTTTATASLTPSSGASQNSHDPGHLSNGYHNAVQSEQPNGTLDLYSKYQQLMMRQESAQKLSTDVRALIESLYRSLREEKAKGAELRGQLTGKHELNLVITEKDKQIETLRKENSILQQSLSDCITQCMSISADLTPPNSQPPRPSSSSASRYLDHLKATFTSRSESYQREIAELTKRLSAIESSKTTERSRYEQLKTKYDNLVQLSENDQLHIKHLQAKITRLTGILFQNGDVGKTTESKQKERRPTTAKASVGLGKKEEEQKGEVVVLDYLDEPKESFDEEGEENLGITSELDELLNSLPPASRS